MEATPVTAPDISRDVNPDTGRGLNPDSKFTEAYRILEPRQHSRKPTTASCEVFVSSSKTAGPLPGLVRHALDTSGVAAGTTILHLSGGWEDHSCARDGQHTVHLLHACRYACSPYRTLEI